VNFRAHSRKLASGAAPVFRELRSSMNDLNPVPDSSETLRQARGLSPRADSSGTTAGFVAAFCLVAAAWFGFARWLLGTEWAMTALTPWLREAAPALGVVVAGAACLVLAMQHARARQQQLQRELRAAETMLLTSQRLEAFGVLAASMAHDFNNTLTVIRGMSDLAKLEAYDPRVSKSAFDAIGLATYRAEEIARHVIEFLNKPKDQFALRDLNTVARDFSSILRQAAGARTMVNYDLEDQLPPTLLNRGMIEQALLNLVINARDAVTKSDPARITISTKSVELIDQCSPLFPTPVSGRFVELTVTDNGCGIPEEDISRAFAPFFTTKRHGTGLGLPSVLRAVQQHDGYVDVRSKIGAGTTVRLLLPIRADLPSAASSDVTVPRQASIA
jgi:signal transduction histidine kinase